MRQGSPGRDRRRRAEQAAAAGSPASWVRNMLRRSGGRDALPPSPGRRHVRSDIRPGQRGRVQESTHHRGPGAGRRLDHPCAAGHCVPSGSGRGRRSLRLRGAQGVGLPPRRLARVDGTVDAARDLGRPREHVANPVPQRLTGDGRRGEESADPVESARARRARLTKRNGIRRCRS